MEKILRELKKEIRQFQFFRGLFLSLIPGLIFLLLKIISKL